MAKADSPDKETDGVTSDALTGKEIKKKYSYSKVAREKGYMMTSFVLSLESYDDLRETARRMDTSMGVLVRRAVEKEYPGLKVDIRGDRLEKKKGKGWKRAGGG